MKPTTINTPVQLIESTFRTTISFGDRIDNKTDAHHVRCTLLIKPMS